MSALANGVVRPEISDPRLNSAPQKGSTIVYQGALCMLDTSGYLRPAAASVSGAYCCGVADARGHDLDRYDSTVTGFTADGSLTVRYMEGTFGFQNDGGSPILATTQPGTILYAVDDQTVSLSSSGGTRPVAGRLRALDSTASGGPVQVDVSKLIGKLATEELAGADNVTLTDTAGVLAIKSSGLRFLCSQGHNGAGAATLTGAKIGDVVVGVSNITDHVTASSSFESTITVADQIQQSSASDLSAKTITVLLISRS